MADNSQFDGATSRIASATECAVLVRQQCSGSGKGLVELEEIRLLAESAGCEVVGAILSNRSAPTSAMFIGKGKVEELQELVSATSATLVIVDHAISPIQERNLESELQCMVVDRTRLILDIFAQRASSREGKLQVELAQLRHLSTRLVRGWTHLERQKGGIGLRGPGETQLETDRRLIGRRIKTLTRRLEKIRKQRDLRRTSRKKVPIPTVSLVGYTNAGKSSLFNRLSGAEVYSADKLFSTLDPTMRRLDLPGFGPVILSDTVGFIRELPHGLVSAFHATLEEIASASVLLHVVDAACENVEDRVANVEQVLDEIGASQVPRIYVYNKIDLIDVSPGLRKNGSGADSRVWISAHTGTGIDDLIGAISDFFRQGQVFGSICIPPSAGRLRSIVYRRIGVVNEQIMESGETILDLELFPKDISWLISNQEFRDEYWHVRPESLSGK